MKIISSAGKKYEVEMGLEVVRSRRQSFGRKRIELLSSGLEIDYYVINSNCSKQIKKHCRKVLPEKSSSPFEALPEDILIRIIFGVEHEDLISLFHVSKAIRQVTLIAKKWHFEYNTPRKTIDFESFVGTMEEPNAPRQSRIPKIQLSNKRLDDISMVLFP
ncbi:unnamed protein product [Cuscuta europaea]|uniref:F-box domain-containing protein n=1 Tax=Cuscuta europaea TaxID=41803 RepID=A0A9P0Z0Q8_CUSEU|nr:unnamed protein product [Cuscuta europaea]